MCKSSGDNRAEPIRLSNVAIAREKIQIKSALRLKSGRSDIPVHLRSTSMSCSDKICKWIILGLQGCGLLASLIESSICLSSIVVSHDERSDPSHQLKALQRALVDRAKESLCLYKTDEKILLPDLFLVSPQFPRGKALTEKLLSDSRSDNQLDIDSIPTKKQKLDHPIGTTSTNMSRSPIGISINWQYDSDHESTHTNKKDNFNPNVELVVGAKGIKQIGNLKSMGDIIKCSSRLSSYNLFCLGLECLENTLKICDDDQNATKPCFTSDIIKKCQNGNISYQEAKRILANSRLRSMKSFIFTSGPLMGWICDRNDFHLYLYKCNSNDNTS